MTYVASVIFAAPDYSVSGQVAGIGLAYFDLASQSDFVYYFDLSSASVGDVGQTLTAHVILTFDAILMVSAIFDVIAILSVILEIVSF